MTKIENYINKDMPSNLNDLEKARYIYLKLADIFSFSTKFNNTSEKEYLNMYNETNTDTNQLNCGVWSSIYSNLLKNHNIENTIVNLGHKYVIFKYNGLYWCADATHGTFSDLAKIKYGANTELFGVCSSQDLSKPSNHPKYIEDINKTLLEIDKKFDFYQKRKEKFDFIFEKTLDIKKQDISIKEKLEKLFEIIGELSNGYYEAKDYVRYLERYLLDEEEMKNVHGVELKRTNNDKSVDIVQCIYLKDENDYSYYLLAPKMKIRKATKEIINELSNIGFGIEKKEIPNIDYIRRFKLGKKDRKILKYRILHGLIPEEIIDYDYKQEKKL